MHISYILIIFWFYHLEAGSFSDPIILKHNRVSCYTVAGLMTYLRKKK